MSSLSVEEKLLLIQQMRNHSETNNVKMQKRNQIYRGLDMNPEEELLSDQPMDAFRFLKFRFFLCLFAFGAFVFMDQNSIRIQGHTAGEVVKMLQTSEKLGKIETVMETWSEQTVDTMRESFK